jgi:hypothetical protein
MAAWLSQLYRSRGEVAPLVATLNQLISLHHFFQHYQRAEYETALKLIEGVKLIPLDADEIQVRVLNALDWSELPLTGPKCP